MKKPTEQDVIEYFSSIGVKNAKIASEWFHEKNAIGWMQGKYKIVDWKSAASLHILRYIERAGEASVSMVEARSDVFSTDDFLKKAMFHHESKAEQNGDRKPSRQTTQSTPADR